MSKNPTVSLIASTYRSDPFLAMWINSIFSLTLWPNTELIIIANEPSEIEKKLLAGAVAQFPNQVHVEHVPRESLYRSWNRALSIAKAGLLGIANVDDLRFPKSLEIQVDSLDSNPEALFCFGSFYTSHSFPPSETSRSKKPIKVPCYQREEFTRTMHLGPFFLWRRTTNAAIRFFDEQFKTAGDFDFAIRLALQGSGVRVSLPLGIYYDAALGLSTSGIRPRVEKNVVLLRYGIYDKLNERYRPAITCHYHPGALLKDASWTPLSAFLPNYESWLEGRWRRWHSIGARRNFVRSALRENPLGRWLFEQRDVKR
jgi:hypothetical protein